MIVERYVSIKAQFSLIFVHLANAFFLPLKNKKVKSHRLDSHAKKNGINLFEKAYKKKFLQ
jgi:hypothetical protein